MIKFAHTNIVTANWRKLAEFYINVFNCQPILPERDLAGGWLDRATNIHKAHIKGVHLALPGYGVDSPTLEIFQYETNLASSEAVLNRKGFGHIAFKVDDVGSVLDRLLANGGTQFGEVVETEIPNAGAITFVYAKDVDGNVIELQNWKRNG